MVNAPIAVTGATGALGSRIAQRLSDRGISTRLIVRNESRAPKLAKAEIAVATFQDKAAMVAALRDIKTAFFVSGFASEKRLEQHKAAIDAFVESGVKRVVYTSFLNAAPDAAFTFARDHYHTEEYMKTVGLRFVALRDSLYADSMPELANEGVIRGPAGDGKFAPVARDDVADVAVELLVDDDHPTTIYDITGLALVTMADVARVLTETSRTPVRFEDETLEEAYASRAHFEATQFEKDGWVTSYTAIATGEFEVVSDTVARIVGRPPKSLQEVLGARC